MHQKTGCSFRVSGISAEVLDEFRQLSDDELQQRNVFRYIADQNQAIHAESASWMLKSANLFCCLTSVT
jgi:hypothetical protein